MARIIINRFKSAICFLFLMLSFSSCADLEENPLVNITDEETETRAKEVGKPLYFYYYDGEKQYFELDTEHIFIKMSVEAEMQEFSLKSTKAFSTRMDTPKKSGEKSFYGTMNLDGKLSDDEYLAKLSEIKASGKGIIVAPYFKNRQQDNIGLSNYFYVKLKQESDITLLEREASRVNAVIDHQNEFMPLWYVLSVTENSEFNAMELSNQFYESGLFQYAEPDFLVEDKINAIYDPYYSQQWNLNNTGQSGGTVGVDINAERAWQISTGSNAIVAVLDQGIELTHTDLAGNIYSQSFDSERGTLTNPVPQTVKGDHGTIVAGVLGALQNNRNVFGSYEGISGVAPDCEIMSVSNSMEATTFSREMRANGINWAWLNGADVITNSWSSAVRHQVIDDAIDDATTRGRGGKGCVVVFSSGNDETSPIVGEPVSYPATLPNVIAVGAIGRTGARANFSNYGPELDVAAPGVDIWSTKWTASYQTFSGTSVAAPHVSGIAALLLSAYPEMTSAAVTQYITNTASNTSWNNQTGWGLVNAGKALLGHFSISGNGQMNLNTNQTFTVPGQNNRPTGVNFSGWTISTNNSYVVTGGTSTETLTIKFTTIGQGTIYANYTLPNGSTYRSSIPVRTYYIPTITHNGSSYLSPGQAVTFTGISTLSNIQWDWEVVSGGYEVGGSGNSFQAQAGSGGSLTVRCRVINMQNGFFSDWATISLPISPYAPAPAPRDEDVEAQAG